MGIAQGFVDDAKAGFPFQVSVGADIAEGYFVEEGDSAEVNGKKWKGPLIVAEKSVIKEISVTVLGADGNTSAVVAKKKSNQPGESKMNFSEWLTANHFKEDKLTEDQKKSLKAQYDLWIKAQEPDDKNKKKKPAETDPETDPVIPGSDPLQAYRKQIADDQTRISALQEVAPQFEGNTKITLNNKETTISAALSSAITDGTSVDAFELACRRASYGQPSGPGIHSKESNVEGEVLQAAIMRECGLFPMNATNKVTGVKYGLESMFTPEVLEKSHE